jgi:hypothetical protein
MLVNFSINQCMDFIHLLKQIGINSTSQISNDFCLLSSQGEKLHSHTWMSIY